MDVLFQKKVFCNSCRTECDRYGIALIFDEVITGFRLSLGGAQKHFGVTPDMSIFGKAMGSGYPISVVAGLRKWMDALEDGSVIHAGTMNAGNPTVAAALATIEVLETENPYQRLFELGRYLMEGLRNAASITGQNLLVQGPGPMFHTGFVNATRVKDFRDTLSYDKKKLSAFIAKMHDRRIRIIGRGLWYLSTVHTREDVDVAIATATEVLHEL